MKTSCFFPSIGESAQMLQTPSAHRTMTATRTGKFVAIASCCQVRDIAPRERPPRSKPKIWLVNDTASLLPRSTAHSFTAHLDVPMLNTLLHDRGRMLRREIAAAAVFD